MPSVDTRQVIVPKKDTNQTTVTSQRTKVSCAVLALMLLGGFAGYNAARFLRIDKPRPADTILVLAGETNVRPERALELVSQGYAPGIIMNVPDWSVFYGVPELDIARAWAAKQSVPVTVCATHGLSTQEESRDMQRCLEAAHVHKILIVTSDFHTRRALSIARRELPGYEFSIASADDPAQFGSNWWQHRQWMKVTFYEWTRMIWWQLVDRWR